MTVQQRVGVYAQAWRDRGDFGGLAQQLGASASGSPVRTGAGDDS